VRWPRPEIRVALIGRLRPPASPTRSRQRLAGTAMEISRFLGGRLPRMPGSATTRGWFVSRDRDTTASIASPLMQPSPIGRRVGIRIVTFEAWSGFTHVTARRIAQPPGRPLSRGSGPAGYPAEPLVSYRINRQLSGWNLPPLMIRLRGARPTSDINHAVAMARGDSDLGVC
jgi:hypothetical protein